MSGNILGQHKGIIHYTIGQRKGFGISFNKPMYVHSKNICDNTITLCEDADLYTSSLVAKDCNLISCANIETPLRIKAKVRYNQVEEWATATQTSDDTIRIVFDEPQRAIAKGQAVVLYDGDVVVGGGTIM